jgi:hypothetical protein
MHPRVDLPDGSYARAGGGDEGADGDVHYVDVEQDLDKVQKGPRPTLPTKASPGSLTLLLKLCNYLCYVCAFTFQELN